MGRHLKKETMRNLAVILALFVGGICLVAEEKPLANRKFYSGAGIFNLNIGTDSRQTGLT